MERLAVKKRVTFRALVPLALLPLLVGCKGNSIEGKWRATGAAAQAGTTTIEFAGGRLSATSDLQNPQVGTLRVTGTGTYTLSGEDLNLVISDVKVDSSGANPMARAFLDQPQFAQRLKSTIGKSGKAKVAFASSDRITLTTSGQTQTLERVK